MEGTNVFEGSSTSTSVALTVTDPASVKEITSSINVSQLASSQTLVFDGFSSSSALVGDGDIVFQRGRGLMVYLQLILYILKKQ